VLLSMDPLKLASAGVLNSITTLWFELSLSKVLAPMTWILWRWKKETSRQRVELEDCMRLLLVTVAHLCLSLM